MKRILRGIKRTDLQYDFDLYRRSVPIPGYPDSYLSLVDLCPDEPKDTIFFIHGYLGCLETWEFQINYFVRHNYRVIAPDLRGHGDSDAPLSRYTMDELVSDLHQIVEHLDLPSKFVLVGHSFGGSICVEYAYAHPHRLSKLILIASAGEYPLPRLANIVFRLPTTFFQSWWRWRPKWNADVHVMKRMMLNNLSRWRGWSLMASLDTRTLVITGERDFYFPKEVFERVGRTIPGADVYDVGSAKHKVQLERHRAVNRQIERYVDESQQLSTWRARHSVDAQLSGRYWLQQYDKGTPPVVPIPHQTLPDYLHRTAQTYAGRRAILFYGNTMSYHQLNERVNRFARVLRTKGVRRGDRVLVVLPNIPQLIIAYYATLRLGAVVVLPNPDADAPRIIAQAKQTRAETLVTLKDFRELALNLQKASDIHATIFTDIRSVVDESTYEQLMSRWGHTLETRQLDGKAADVCESMEDLIRGAVPLKIQDAIDPAALAVIIFTSGTTQEPKGVCLSHRNLVANAIQTRHWTPQLQNGKEVFLSIIPLMHSYGMTNAMNIPILMGATIILMPVFEAKEVLKQIKEFKPTALPGVPSMYTAINQMPNVREYGLSSIRACICGAAPLPIEVQEAFEKLTKGCLVEGYGLTEASPVTHANPLTDKARPGTIGLPIPSTEARIVDLMTQEPIPRSDSGAERLSNDLIGELQIRGPQVMLGYWNTDGSFDRSTITHDGWLSTGDLAVHDQDGYFQIISRKRDTIMAGEYSVYPRDVEEVLYENNKVMEVAVVGVTVEESMNNPDHIQSRDSSAREPVASPAMKPTQRVKAFVVPRPGVDLSADELLALCRKRLEPYAVPWEIEFREELPKSFVGKILRRMLVQNKEDNTK